MVEFLSPLIYTMILSASSKSLRQPTKWENIFTNPTSERGMIYKIYEELKKLDIKIPNNPTKNAVQI